MTIQSPPCPGCQEVKTLEVTAEAYMAWQMGKHIQDAMPELSANDRERLITGYCPECWDELFSEEEE